MLLRHPSSHLLIPSTPTGLFTLPPGSTPKACASPGLLMANKINADGHLRHKSQANIKPNCAPLDLPCADRAIQPQCPRWKIGPAQQSFSRKGLLAKTCVNSPNTSIDNIVLDPMIQTPCEIVDNHPNLNKTLCNGGVLTPKDNSVLKELPSWTTSKAKSILIGPKKTEKQRKDITPRRDPHLNKTISENAIRIDEEENKPQRNETFGSSPQENRTLGNYLAQIYHMKITESQCSQSFAAKEKQLQNNKMSHFPIEEEQGNVASFCRQPGAETQNNKEYAQLKHEYDVLALEYAKAMDSEQRASEYQKKVLAQQNEINSLVATIQELKSSHEKRENSLKDKIVILTQQITLLTSGQFLKQKKGNENATPLEKENEFLWKLLRCFQNQKDDECLNATQTSLLNETLQEGKSSGIVNTIEISQGYRSSDFQAGMDL